MQLARIDGNVVSTIAHPSMRGCKTLICQPIDEAGADIGQPVLALDTLGAGLHSKVFITTDGSFAQDVVKDETSPIRNSVLGIVDEPRENT